MESGPLTPSMYKYLADDRSVQMSLRLTEPRQSQCLLQLNMGNVGYSKTQGKAPL